MHTGILKSGFIFFLSLLLCVNVQAQQSHFIYIQTENKEPFYVKMDNRVFSSSGSGYIIISGLTDNAYKLVIGFPDNEGSELNVTVDVKDTDAGFLLKNYNEGGWGMINLQSTEFLVMQKSFVLIKEVEEKTSGNEFARILAAVVNDPSIAEVSVAKKITETAIKIPENKTMDIPVKDSSIAEVSVSKKVTDTATKTTEVKPMDIPVKDSTIAEVTIAKKITETAILTPENKTINIPVNDSSIAEVSVAKKISETAIITPETKTMDIPVKDSTIAEVTIAKKITETAILTPENKTTYIPVNDSSIVEVSPAKTITDTATKTAEIKPMVIPVNDSSIAEISTPKKITETAIKTPENKTIAIPVNDSSTVEVSIAKKISETVINTTENKTIATPVNDSSIVEVSPAKTITDTATKTAEIKPMVIPVNDSSIAEVSAAKKVTEPAINTTENKTIATPVNDSSIVEVSTPKKISETVINTTENKTIAITVNKTVLPGSVSKKDIVDSLGTRFINMELQNPNAKPDSGSVKKDDFVIKEKKQTKVTESDSDKEVNLNCKRTATQSDFLKLRKLMAGAGSEQNMIKAAYKQFATACYTTEQIKNLGVLFIVEEEKYKFYLAAFPYVTDRDNYGILKHQFTDNYYKTRFSAMMGN